MREILLYGSYTALWGLVAFETVVLLGVLRQVVRLKREIYEATPVEVKEERLAGGTFIDFAARDVTHGGLVRAADLRGAPAALLFLGNDAGFGDEIPEWLLDTFAGLKVKAEGRIFVLYDGGAEEGSALARLAGPEVPVLLDEGGEIRRRYMVRSTPGAVLLDGDAGVTMYGRPEIRPS